MYNETIPNNIINVGNDNHLKLILPPKYFVRVIVNSIIPNTISKNGYVICCSKWAPASDCTFNMNHRNVMISNRSSNINPKMKPWECTFFMNFSYTTISTFLIFFVLL